MKKLFNWIRRNPKRFTLYVVIFIILSLVLSFIVVVPIVLVISLYKKRSREGVFNYPIGVYTQHSKFMYIYSQSMKYMDLYNKSDYIEKINNFINSIMVSKIIPEYLEKLKNVKSYNYTIMEYNLTNFINCHNTLAHVYKLWNFYKKIKLKKIKFDENKYRKDYYKIFLNEERHIAFEYILPLTLGIYHSNKKKAEEKVETLTMKDIKKIIKNKESFMKHDIKFNDIFT